MGHIVRRGEPAAAPPRREALPTTKISELKLDELIRDHVRAESDSGMELELIPGEEILDQAGDDARVASPGAAPRLAHTLRRDLPAGATEDLIDEPAHDLANGTPIGISTIAMPRLARPAAKSSAPAPDLDASPTRRIQAEPEPPPEVAPAPIARLVRLAPRSSTAIRGAATCQIEALRDLPALYHIEQLESAELGVRGLARTVTGRATGGHATGTSALAPLPVYPERSWPRALLLIAFLIATAALAYGLVSVTR